MSALWRKEEWARDIPVFVVWRGLIQRLIKHVMIWVVVSAVSRGWVISSLETGIFQRIPHNSLLFSHHKRALWLFLRFLSSRILQVLLRISKPDALV
jgi:hypothetical protein